MSKFRLSAHKLHSELTLTMTEIEVWSIRLDPDVASQLVRIAEELTKRAAGAKVTRSQVARMAGQRGLPALEKELGLERKTRKRKK